MFWEFLAGLGFFGVILAVATFDAAAVIGALVLICLCIWHWARRAA